VKSRNSISERAILVGDVTMGSGNIIGDNSILIGPLQLGDNNFIGQNVILGSIPQDDIYDLGTHEKSLTGKTTNFKSLKIGDGNIFREFTSAHRGAFRDTIIGSNNFVMSYTNISHDTIIGNNVKLASNVTLGGFVQIHDNSYLGMATSVLQFTVIGSFVMVGAHSTVTSDMKPGIVCYGSPARVKRLNIIGLARIGIHESEELHEYITAETLPNLLQKELENFDCSVTENSHHRSAYRQIRSNTILGLS